MAGIAKATLPRKRSVNIYVTKDRVVANKISVAVKESDFRRKCEICGKKFKSNKQAYAHQKSHGNAVIVQKIEVAVYFQEDKRIVCDTIIGTSNAVESEAYGGERGRCVPPDAKDNKQLLVYSYTFRGHKFSETYLTKCRYHTTLLEFYFTNKKATPNFLQGKLQAGTTP